MKTPKFEVWFMEEEPNERSAYWVVVFNDGYNKITTIRKFQTSDRYDTRAEECAAQLNKTAGFLDEILLR